MKNQKIYKKVLDWTARNATTVIGIVGAIAAVGYSRFVITTVAIGVAISFISITLAQIALYCLTRMKFLEPQEIGAEDSEMERAAKILHNGLIRFVPVLIYGSIMIGFAISIFIAQWRVDGGN